jgi:hypothetical protein
MKFQRSFANNKPAHGCCAISVSIPSRGLKIERRLDVTALIAQSPTPASHLTGVGLFALTQSAARSSIPSRGFLFFVAKLAENPAKTY